MKQCAVGIVNLPPAECGTGLDELVTGREQTQSQGAAHVHFDDAVCGEQGELRGGEAGISTEQGRAALAVGAHGTHVQAALGLLQQANTIAFERDVLLLDDGVRLVRHARAGGDAHATARFETIVAGVTGQGAADDGQHPVAFGVPKRVAVHGRGAKARHTHRRGDVGGEHAPTRFSCRQPLRADDRRQRVQYARARHLDAQRGWITVVFHLRRSRSFPVAHPLPLASRASAAPSVWPTSGRHSMLRA